jgi:hypothetical protein
MEERPMTPESKPKMVTYPLLYPHDGHCHYWDKCTCHVAEIERLQRELAAVTERNENMAKGQGGLQDMNAKLRARVSELETALQLQAKEDDHWCPQCEHNAGK